MQRNYNTIWCACRGAAGQHHAEAALRHAPGPEPGAEGEQRGHRRWGLPGERPVAGAGRRRHHAGHAAPAEPVAAAGALGLQASQNACHLLRMRSFHACLIQPILWAQMRRRADPSMGKITGLTASASCAVQQEDDECLLPSGAVRLAPGAIATSSIRSSLGCDMGCVLQARGL